ncbi:hypothetical protein Hypma_006913 [Hypsizygus marmoreus]|uniref:Uncharacterized protein n=1 Tax=Hypsizygus marmoreus TaxID=39966 RepID=A0A369JW64_HYPMA|nr:hypothetical protein Hypma_006913 [Hypsizygus marmoreus]
MAALLPINRAILLTKSHGTSLCGSCQSAQESHLAYISSLAEAELKSRICAIGPSISPGPYRYYKITTKALTAPFASTIYFLPGHLLLRYASKCKAEFHAPLFTSVLAGLIGGSLQERGAGACWSGITSGLGAALFFMLLIIAKVSKYGVYSFDNGHRMPFNAVAVIATVVNAPISAGAFVCAIATAADVDIYANTYHIALS